MVPHKVHIMTSQLLFRLHPPIVTCGHQFEARIISYTAYLTANSYLPLMNRTCKSKKMSNKDECPCCGGNPIRKYPYSDRVESAGIGGGVAGASAKGEIQIRSNPQKEEYYQCNGCNQTYVWADINIDLILPHLEGGENIPKLLLYYYPDGVTLVDLLTCHTTGFIRRHSSKFSWLSNMIVKRHLYACFNYNGKRTIATLVRRKKTKYYYTVKTVGILNI